MDWFCRWIVEHLGYKRGDDLEFFTKSITVDGEDLVAVSRRGQTKGLFIRIHVHRELFSELRHASGSSSSHCTISEVSEIMRVQMRRQIRLTSVRNVAKFFLGR